MKLVLENRKYNQLKEKLFYIGILSIITVIVWIGVNVYAAFSKTSIDPEMTKLTQPLNPVLNTQVLLDYAASRVVPPTEFTITAQYKTESASTVQTKLIDPNNPLTAQTVRQPVASGSARTAR